MNHFTLQNKGMWFSFSWLKDSVCDIVNPFDHTVDTEASASLSSPPLKSFSTPCFIL